MEAADNGRKYPALALAALAMVTVACVCTRAVSGIGSLGGLGQDAFEQSDGLRTTGGGLISIGQTASGTLDSLQEAHNWTFDGTAGQTVEIRALAVGNSDPRIKLYDPNETLIAEDDDDGGDLDSLIIATLPADGQYVIRVDVFTEGPYDIILNTAQGGASSSGVPTDSITGGGTLSVGSSANGVLDSVFEFHEWTFSGGQGQTVSITVAGNGDSDPRFDLIGPNGGNLATDDDSGGDFDAFVSLTLPADGTYTIRIDMFTSGPYTVTVQ